jgi:hypothetical protein
VSWTDERIRAALEPVLAGRTTFPTIREFAGQSHSSLARAITARGGFAHWAAEMGLPRSRRDCGSRRYWTDARIEATLRDFSQGHDTYPCDESSATAGSTGCTSPSPTPAATTVVQKLSCLVAVTSPGAARRRSVPVDPQDGLGLVRRPAEPFGEILTVPRAEVEEFGEIVRPRAALSPCQVVVVDGLAAAAGATARGARAQSWRKSERLRPSRRSRAAAR